MGKMKQSDAVTAAVVSVCADAGVEFEVGTTVADDVVTDTMRKSISEILCEGFRAGAIELSDTPSNRDKLASPPKLNQYVSGLISNWFRKGPDLNGSTKYQPKNPGSRAGQSDPQLKALMLLATKFKGTDKEAELFRHIQLRKEQIAATKAKTVTIDLSALSPELIAQLGLK
jgi:hypothetical protein